MANGCGWRWKDNIVTAAHVIEGGYRKYGLGVPEGPIYELDISKALTEDDLAVIPVSQTLLSRVGLKTATLDNAPDLFVRITGPVQPGTTIGMLKPTNVFGILEYTGTTFPGYSGAPYIASARTVVAMHLSGGTSNLCYASAYISMRLSRMMGVETEEDDDDSIIPEKKKGKNKVGRGSTRKRKSADWYSEELGPDTKIKVRRSRHDPTEWEVELNDHYYVMAEDEYANFYRHAKSKRAWHIDNAPAPKVYSLRNYGKGVRVEKAACSTSEEETSDDDSFLGEDSDMMATRNHSLELLVLMRQISESLKISTNSKVTATSTSCKPPDPLSMKTLNSDVEAGESKNSLGSGKKRKRSKSKKKTLSLSTIPSLEACLATE